MWISIIVCRIQVARSRRDSPRSARWSLMVMARGHEFTCFMMRASSRVFRRTMGSAAVMAGMAGCGLGVLGRSAVREAGNGGFIGGAKTGGAELGVFGAMLLASTETLLAGAGGVVVGGTGTEALFFLVVTS